MKMLKITFTALTALGLIFTFAYAAGDVERGKALFNDPKAFGAPGEKSCSSCHPDGKGLEKAGEKGKKMWRNPAGLWLSIEDTINVCVVMANKGKALDPKSQEMADLVAYIKSLGRKTGKR